VHSFEDAVGANAGIVTSALGNMTHVCTKTNQIVCTPTGNTTNVLGEMLQAAPPQP